EEGAALFRVSKRSFVHRKRRRPFPACGECAGRLCSRRALCITACLEIPVEIALFAGVALLTLAAPFELTEPLVRLPHQSISSLETAVLLAFGAWAAAIAAARRLPDWRTPLTLPWTALLLA